MSKTNKNLRIMSLFFIFPSLEIREDSSICVLRTETQQRTNVQLVGGGTLQKLAAVRAKVAPATLVGIRLVSHKAFPDHQIELLGINPVFRREVEAAGLLFPVR